MQLGTNMNYKLTLIIVCSLALGLPLLSSYFQHQPLPLGEETYYHLASFPFLPRIVSFLVVPLLPLLGLASIILAYHLARRWKVSEKTTFIFLALLTITPAFILTFSTLSAPGLFFFLLLLSLYLLETKWPYLAAIPLLLATHFDTASTLLLLLIIGHYAYQKRTALSYILVSVVILSLALHLLFLPQPFLQGPFHQPHYAEDLISDLGGESGMGLLVFSLALFGLFFSPPRAYVFLAVTIPLYIYSTQAAFYLSLAAVFFATQSILYFQNRKWNYPFLHNFILLLILLGALFSTTTFLQRIPVHSPGYPGQEALLWLQDHSDEEDLIFSLPEEGHYIQYFAQRQPFYTYNQHHTIKENLTQTILTSTYTSTTFPLLEEQNITILYITPRLRARYPPEQGLLFLLKNEKFKLLYSQEGYEIWVYTQE